MVRRSLTALAAAAVLAAAAAGCGGGQKPPPNPLQPTAANVAFCREGQARMIKDGLDTPMTSLRRHISRWLSDDLTGAQSYFLNYFGVSDEAFPEMHPADVRLSLRSAGVLADCRLILTEARA